MKYLLGHDASDKVQTKKTIGSFIKDYDETYMYGPGSSPHALNDKHVSSTRTGALT